MMKIKNHLDIVYIDANNLYGCAMSQKLPVHGFEWVEDLSDFIKNHDEDSDVGYIIEADVNIREIYKDYIVIYHSYQKERKLMVVKSLYVICMIKKLR